MYLIFTYQKYSSFTTRDVQSGTGPGTKLFFDRDRALKFFPPGPGPKMTGPAHVYSRQLIAFSSKVLHLSNHVTIKQMIPMR